MFEPDIMVTDHGDYAERFIVVEVKSSPVAFDAVEDDLRGYMVRNNWMLGMLIAPGEIRLYRNRYSSYEADSVERIGSYPLAAFDPFATPTRDHNDMARLETDVQEWIERLPLAASLDAVDASLRSALAEDFVPCVRAGVVRAAHHRRQPVRAAEGRPPR